MSSRKTSLALVTVVLLAIAGSASAAVVCQSPTAVHVRSGSECDAAERKLPIEIVTITAGSPSEGSVETPSGGPTNENRPSTETDCVTRLARACGATSTK